MGVYTLRWWRGTGLPYGRFWQYRRGPFLFVATLMVSVAAMGGALTMHNSPVLGLVRESTECGRYGLFRWEYDYHSLFNTTPMEPTTEEDAEHDSDAERDWDYDDLGGIKIVHQSYKSRQVQAIQTGFLKHIEQLR